MKCIPPMLSAAGAMVCGAVVAAVVAPASVIAAEQSPEERVEFLERKLDITQRELELTRRRLGDLRREMNDLEPFLAEARYRLLVQEISRQTADVRGLELKEPVESQVLDAQGLSDLLDRLLDAEMSAEDFDSMTLAWTAFDLLPAGTRIDEMYVNLLEGQVGGLYDDSTKSLYVVDVFDPTSLFGRIILSHEICHALQDQNFTIADLPFRTEDNDQNLAMAAVLEGDATITMIEWAMQYGGGLNWAEIGGMVSTQTEQMDALAQAPPAMVQMLLFPYVAGAEFMASLAAAGHSRDYPFGNPPTTTEQILDFDKFYPVPESAVAVQLPEWGGHGGLAERDRNTMGEWMTRLVLTPPDAFPNITAFSLDVMARDPVAVEAARGWGGDQYVLASDESGGTWVLVWDTAWDTDGDAAEFADAWRRRVALRDGLDGSHDIMVDGDRVTVVTGSDPGAARLGLRWLGR